MMLGLYDRTPRRRKVILDGWWEFCTDPSEQGESGAYFAHFPKSRRVWVPGCWSTELGLQGYQGVAWYRKSFHCDFEGRAKLTFGAVADHAKVWLNGLYLGEHEGGFTAFDLLAELRPGENEIVVRVDNRHSDITLPKEGVDWFPYGGITRSVICEEIGTSFIQYIHVRSEVNGQVEVRAYLWNPGQSAVTCPLSLAIGDKVAQERSVTIAGGERQEEVLQARIAHPHLWSPEHLHLYMATVHLGKDEYRTRFGLREVRVVGKHLLLNGKRIFIRGVNRHEDHPDWGFALPPKLMKQDIDIIKDLNCNAIRGSHYPNHPAFLDLCDEEGLLFFAEIPAWQYSALQLATSPTKEKMTRMLQEMIIQQFNHPCIFAWSLHNECQTDVEKVGDVDLAAATRELFALARSLDDTRPVTYVSHKYWHDKHLALADILCLNAYIGWYVDELEGGDLREYLRRMAELHPDKPILITEFGAGGIPGYRNLSAPKWSEEYQAQHLRRSIEMMRENDQVAGCFVWQYCDTLVHPARALRRPRSLNNKGLVDEYRRPKLSYFTVREIFECISGGGNR